MYLKIITLLRLNFESFLPVAEAEFFVPEFLFVVEVNQKLAEENVNRNYMQVFLFLSALNRTIHSKHGEPCNFYKYINVCVCNYACIYVPSIAK